MSVKILHCADLHLGAAFTGLTDENATIRKKEQLETFDKIIETAKTENIDMLFISGDLFDNQNISSIVKHIISSFNEISDINIFIAAGNHDNIEVYEKYNWGENVHIFSRDFECIEINNVCIYGASFSNNCENKFDENFIFQKEKINILVMHGDVEHGSYNPMSKEFLKQFDYAALGHIHKHSGVISSGMSSYSYSGFTEPVGFDENGRGGVMCGVIGKGYVDLTRIEVSKREYIYCKIDISDCENNIDVADHIQRIIQTENLYKVELTGRYTFDISIDYIKECIENFCFHIEIIQNNQIDYEQMIDEYSLRGLFVKRMLEYIKNSTGAEKDMYKQALQTGLDAMSESEVKLFD